MPYAYNALEPRIDTRTMMIHHNGHYATYVENLNKYLADKPQLQNLTLEELIVYHSNDDEIRHNAGGVYNHQLFFGGMRPGMNQIVVGLSGRFLQNINRDFGSLENFKMQFGNAAAAVFGSGYAWLAVDSRGKLHIVQTANQDTPLTLSMKPLLNLDVWEHAYYLKYTNHRTDYINNYFALIDWVRVGERLIQGV